MQNRRETDPDEASVVAWLIAVAAGDRDALAVLYGQTSPRLMAVLLRLLRRRELAEDLLHDVYLRVWDRAGTFDPKRGSATGWLLAIARNVALDHCRRQRHQVLGADDRIDPTDGASPPDPAALADASEAARALQACMERLEPEPRRCLTLAYYEGLTYDELARTLDRPVGTIKSWVRRSLDRLRLCLDAP
jgi:RNA polymerase sigma-70 factor (ECF subfamily)